MRDPRQHILRSADSYEHRLEQRVADLEAAVAMLQRTPTIAVSGAAPSTAAADGSAVVEPTRLWVRVAGVWKYVTIT